MGQTYGKLTSRLLADPEGPRSGQSLLQLCRCPSARDSHLEKGAGEPNGTKARSFGCCTVPGYAGFIPLAQNHFAKTYGRICKEASHEFARQLERGTGRTPGQSPAASPRDIKTGKLLPAKEKPLLPAFPQASALRRPQRAPAAKEDGPPQKTFISGFTGFVPRARYLIGVGYPVLTRRAWMDFHQMLQKPPQDASLGSSDQRNGGGQMFPPLVKTYPTDRGLLPHYKGHVPGYKFRFGRTYGRLTYDALGRSSPEKLMADRLP